MSFNSYIYVFAFLPLTFFVYQLLRNTRFANVFLTIASLYFYAFSAAWYLVPLLISSILDYIVGIKIESSSSQRTRSRLLILSVVANLGMLSVFKYTGWISSELSYLASLAGFSISTIAVGLPPGISFYTFQTMSYTIDIARGEFKPRRNFFDYIAFVSFFPQLVAGPIERARNLLPQIEQRRERVSAAVASGALFLILFGLFQKVVLADGFGGIVEFTERTIAKGGTMPAGMGILFTYAFAFQIYCDFAAYSLIARGTARLFGIELSRNFLTPYFSASPSEFWSRWHISLSSWLRDYLYIPLGGNQRGKLLTLRNLVLTMALGGLWHGAGVLFVVWGLYHGLLLVLYRLVPIDSFLISRLGRTGKLIAIVIFFHLVCVGWIFFRASPSTIVAIWSSILATPELFKNAYLAYLPYVGKVDLWHILYGAALHVFKDPFLKAGCFVFMVLSIPLMIFEIFGYKHECEFPDLWVKMKLAIKVAVSVALFYGVVFYGAREANEFIYFQF